ncbi:MAG: flagellar basal body L-ring protein FlgH [Betaproteobacteria bacterium]|nr:flagellar basal body L-ring protein FlgH [Betaproteobacteria bacterium]
MTRLLILSALAGVAVLSGCAAVVPQPEVAVQAPSYAPVLPVETPKARVATGSIFSAEHAQHWLGSGRHYRVGDVITVMLQEDTTALRQQDATIKRDAKNDMIPSGFTSKFEKVPGKILGSTFAGALSGVNLNSASISTGGSGAANQKASLQGAVTVTVVEVLGNGNLVIRGEKQLSLTEGSEIVQVSGIVRPEDISPNNVVQSRRLANANIAYRGTGDMAKATTPGWGTSLLLKVWPF